SRAGVLEVRGNAHPVVHAGSAANDRIRSELVSKSHARCPIVAVNRHVALAVAGIFCEALQCARNQRQSVHVDSAVGIEVTKLDPLEALALARARFVAHSWLDS